MLANVFVTVTFSLTQTKHCGLLHLKDPTSFCRVQFWSEKVATHDLNQIDVEKCVTIIYLGLVNKRLTKG